MDPSALLAWDPVLEGLLALGLGAVVVGAVSSSIRELAGGYWVLGWAALLITGALFLLEDVGFPVAGRIAFVTDAFFAPLMFMGALELRAERPAPRWPLVVALVAGLLRVAFDLAGLPNGLALLAASVAPAFLAAAAVASLRAPAESGLRAPIAILLSALVFHELFDAWNDWAREENRILWRFLIILCVPLAALQIASRLMALRAGLVSAEAASNLAERERDLERRRLAVVFDRVRELVAELDAETRIHFVNERARELLGLDPRALIGRRALDFVPPDRRREAETIWRRHLEPGGLRDPVVFEMAGADGRPVYLEITVSEYAFAGDRRLLVLARDATLRQRVEQEREDRKRALEVEVAESHDQLRASHDRLRDQERLAAIGTLAAGVAHQINNPVGAISAAAEFALLAGDEPDARSVQEESLRRIVDEADRAGRIVKNVLQFARHESTAKWVEDLGSVVRQSLEIARPYVLERGGRLELDAPSAALPMRMSPIEIEQMVVNLIRNAAESRRSGVKIRTSLRAAGELAILEVRDDGCGVAAEHRSQVFDPFFTTRLREGGSGLGLSVVHGIVTDHGGEIEVESEVDAGTTVRIRLPLGRGAPATAS